MSVQIGRSMDLSGNFVELVSMYIWNYKNLIMTHLCHRMAEGKMLPGRIGKSQTSFGI
jgi:hypothetical protein